MFGCDVTTTDICLIHLFKVNEKTIKVSNQKKNELSFLCDVLGKNASFPFM